MDNNLLYLPKERMSGKSLEVGWRKVFGRTDAMWEELNLIYSIFIHGNAC